MQTLGGGEIEEAGQIEASVHSELVGPRLVEVPRYVRFHGVEPHETGLVEPVSPEVGMDAEVVQSAGEDAEGLAVEPESVVLDLEKGHARAPQLGRDALIAPWNCRRLLNVCVNIRAMASPLYAPRSWCLRGNGLELAHGADGCSPGDRRCRPRPYG
ncbi:hypothetical protein Slala05_67470 [Streptomyces lavendulae subsp. lavendulae]|nr:hypothetical protein Slala05_67470 [Streptomyces lavendulae subsp. lavendulae]